jgi:electron transfer flavoprotein beta subunit
MWLIVCIKQVPDTSNIKIDPEKNTIVREGVETIINPFDKHGIETAIQLKEKNKFIEKTIGISMGPPQAKEALKECLGLGIDEAILLSDEEFAGSDTLATSYILSRAIKKLRKHDLIICGQEAIDGDTAQVGPQLAEFLNIPHITRIRKIKLINNGKLARVERTIEGGYEIIECQLPLLVTVTKEINQPRPLSLKGVLEAKKRRIKIWNSKRLKTDPSKIGLKGSATEVIKIFTPPLSKNRRIFKGEASQLSKEFLSILRKKKVI